VGFKVFKNRVLRTIFGPKEEGLTGRWRELHNETLCDFFLLNILAY
jgi:hypothetical protein